MKTLDIDLIKDLMWIGLTIGGIVYAYGTLSTKVSALESNNPIQVGKDIVELKVRVDEIRTDVKEIKNAVLKR